MSEIEKAIYTAKQAKTYIVTKYIENGFLDKAIVFEKHFDLAIQALQEKLERDKGCSYCDIAKNSPIVYLEYLNQFGFLGGNTQADEVTRKSISHCPMCGRKLVK